MKKTLLLLLLITAFASTAHAQLPNGSIAPDWTLTDMEGDSHHLYEVLESGKSVVLDFSATWCGPCWSYHNTKSMENIYQKYGPDGTDEVRVYYVESDASTTDPCVYGDTENCVGGTQGDWTEGSSYPIFNPDDAAVPGAYGINAYPTLIAVCSDKKMYEVGQIGVTAWENWLLKSCTLESDYLTTDSNCASDPDGTITLNPSGGFGTLRYEWSNGSMSQNLVNQPPGNYSVTISDANSRDIVIEDIILDGATIPVTIDNNEIENILCNGDGNGSISVEASSGVAIDSYSWSNGETTSSISNLVPGSYTVTATDVTGCFVEETFEVSEPAVLGLTTSAVDDVCARGSGVILSDLSGGTGPFTYFLNGEEVFSENIYDLSAGDYTLEIIDANGCTVSSSASIEEIPGPIAAIEEPEVLSCEFNTITLVGSTNVNSSISYTWTTTDGNIVSGGNTATPIVNEAGTYNLLIQDNGTNCTGEASIEVEGNFDTPTATAGTGQTLDCNVSEITLNGTGSTTGANYDYTWSTANGNIVSDGTTLEPTINAPGTYTLEVLNTTNGCTATSSVIITQSDDVPMADAGEAESITCIIDQITLDGSNSDSGNDLVYSWTTENGNIVEGSSTLNPIINQAGTYLLKVTNTSNGCESLSSVSVGLNQTPPEIEVEGDLIVSCDEPELTIELGEGAYSEVVWATEDGSIVNQNDDNSVVVDAPGEYTVTVVSSENGCSNTAIVTVSQSLDYPSSEFTFDQSDFTVDFNTDVDATKFSFLWEFGDGTTSTEEDPIHTYTAAGTYTVCLTVENGCGTDKECTDVSINFDVVSFTSPVTCFGDCDGAYDFSINGETSGYVIEIKDGATVVSSDFTGTLCAGTYEATITNTNGETIAIENFTIETPQELIVEANKIVNVLCHGDENGSIELDINGGTSDYSIVWDNEAVGESIDNLGAGDYVAQVTDANGCSVNITVTINQPDEILLFDNIIVDNTNASQPNGSVEVSIVGGVEPYTYEWSNGSTDAIAKNLTAGDYTVIVTDANGCENTYGPFTVEQMIGVVDVNTFASYNVFPNPVSNNLNIEIDLYESNAVKLQLLDKVGKVVKSEEITGNTVRTNWDINNIPSGMYILSTQVGNDFHFEKVIKH